MALLADLGVAHDLVSQDAAWSREASGALYATPRSWQSDPICIRADSSRPVAGALCCTPSRGVGADFLAVWSILPEVPVVARARFSKRVRCATGEAASDRAAVSGV